ncbi:MAG: hypothetical protein KGQ93_15250 [Cyanobacteria bacterium REEB459]|nr:hypothetical protein [Cyanobacteria bacterium REEB459]
MPPKATPNTRFFYLNHLPDPDAFWVSQAFTPGYNYLKAKVIATHLSPADQVQGSLLAPVVDRAKREVLVW